MPDTGYIFLTTNELEKVCLIHLISGLDEDGPPDGALGATATAITGYTEWIGEAGTRLTIGWDWQLLSDTKDLKLIRIGLPSSNVMLRTPAQVDMGPATTRQLLALYIDTVNWQSETLNQINIRYAVN